MNGYQFEKYIGNLYRNLGYVVQNTALSGDQGADLILEKNGQKIAIQTKRYAKKVSNKAVQEVVASKAYYNCSHCVVITNNYFTKSASDLAKANNVELIDRDNLASMIYAYFTRKPNLEYKKSKNNTDLNRDVGRSSNRVVCDDAIEKHDVELLCPTCEKKSIYNVDIKKLTSGKSIESRCNNCGMPITLSL
ncbi:hypothetical protein HNV12_12800 [Methanococcoides sp. SA1]|nr:hypothetical protein [Methanococcoides sp. SA1]